jgi:hypothetical protein
MNVPTPSGESPLPTDVASCHALIRQLARELDHTRCKLAVYVENERRLMEWRYGKGATAQTLLAFGQRIEQMHVQRRGRKE